MKFSEELLPILWRILEQCIGADLHMNPAGAIDELEIQAVTHVQSAMRSLGKDLAYGEAFSLWSLVSLDCQTTWVEAHNVEHVLIELERLCENVRDGCDYAGISKPIR